MEEFSVLSKQQICESLAELLDDDGFADLVIPDLARAKDWRHIATLQQRFRDAQPHEHFVRVPIINYLRLCPLPAAKEALSICKLADPVAFRQAQTIFPIAEPDETEASKSEPSEKAGSGDASPR